MSLFKRQAPMAEFVLTPDGWYPLDPVMQVLWQRLAATAWEGYSGSGRGFLDVYFGEERADFVPIKEFLAFCDERREREVRKQMRKVREQCSRYKPDSEIVIMLYGARNAKAARAHDIEVFFAVVATPSGLPTPPQAAQLQRTSAAAREYVSALQQQWGQQYAQRQQKGLDADAV